MRHVCALLSCAPKQRPVSPFGAVMNAISTCMDGHLTLSCCVTASGIHCDDGAAAALGLLGTAASSLAARLPVDAPTPLLRPGDEVVEVEACWDLLAAAAAAPAPVAAALLRFCCCCWSLMDRTSSSAAAMRRFSCSSCWAMCSRICNPPAATCVRDMVARHGCLHDWKGVGRQGCARAAACRLAGDLVSPKHMVWQVVHACPLHRLHRLLTWATPTLAASALSRQDSMLFMRPSSARFVRSHTARMVAICWPATSILRCHASDWLLKLRLGRGKVMQW